MSAQLRANHWVNDNRPAVSAASYRPLFNPSLRVSGIGEIDDVFKFRALKDAMSSMRGQCGTALTAAAEFQAGVNIVSSHIPDRPGYDAFWYPISGRGDGGRPIKRSFYRGDGVSPIPPSEFVVCEGVPVATSAVHVKGTDRLGESYVKCKSDKAASKEILNEYRTWLGTKGQAGRDVLSRLDEFGNNIMTTGRGRARTRGDVARAPVSDSFDDSGLTTMGSPSSQRRSRSVPVPVSELKRPGCVIIDADAPKRRLTVLGPRQGSVIENVSGQELITRLEGLGLDFDMVAGVLRTPPNERFAVLEGMLGTATAYEVLRGPKHQD